LPFVVAVAEEVGFDVALKAGFGGMSWHGVGVGRLSG
jgi:hypothetical protein